MSPSAESSPALDEGLEVADLRALYAALLEAVDQSVILTDMAGRIRGWNAEATRIFGYRAEEMIGRTPAELYPDLHPERLAADLARILSGEEYAGEWKGRRRDGGDVWVDVRTRLVRDASGRALGFLGVARDITERKRSEAALASGQARLELIANTAPAFIVQCDSDRRFTFVNRAYAARFGCEPDQVVGKYVWEVVGEQAYAGFRHHVDEVLAGQRVEFEMEIPYELIGRHYIHCAYAPQFDLDGSVVGLVAVITDVSERKRAEAALREQEALLRTVLETLPVGVLVCDKDGALTYVNPAGHRIWGGAPLVSRQDWGVFQTWWPDGRPLRPEENPLGEVLRSGVQQIGLEWEIETFDGKRKSILSSHAPLRDGGGAIIGAVSLNLDVTEQKRADAALRQLDRVETVARLAGGVAHEANNQMAVVLGAASFILRRSDLPEAVREDAVYIQEAAERTAAITQQLLAFSRRQVLQPRVLDLNATIRAFETILRRTVAADVELRLDLVPGLGLVRIDEGQLQQVLLNLTLNARDAMPEGGTLTLQTREVTLRASEAAREGLRIRPGSYVELVVRDTGIGMDAATLAHMFEPFFTTKGVGRGTGLGLASVYGIVKQSQGYVFAESAPGRGTTITVLLPVATDPVAPETESRGTEAQRGRGTALVVDDEPVVRSMMVRALREAGYSVLDAESAAAALELARSFAGRLDILISDLAMPGMPGRELAERLVERHAGLGVLFVSGYPGEEVERRGLLESGRPFLQKPFAPETLVERVGRLLDGAGTQSGRPSER